MTDTAPPQKMYGWFSDSAHSISALQITYNTPSNKHVIVTSVTDSSTDPKNTWADNVCLGEVTNFVDSTNQFTTKFKKN